MSMQPPARKPENGFYYHYKHTPNGDIGNYAYEVVGVGVHTEEDGVFFVLYRPLYPSSVYEAGQLFDVRPLDMWMGDVTKGEKTFPRFSRITDPDIIAQLEVIRDNMYNQ